MFAHSKCKQLLGGKIEKAVCSKSAKKVEKFTSSYQKVSWNFKSYLLQVLNLVKSLYIITII